jgi:hypothetical protein
LILDTGMYRASGVSCCRATAPPAPAAGPPACCWAASAPRRLLSGRLHAAGPPAPPGACCRAACMLLGRQRPPAPAAGPPACCWAASAPQLRPAAGRSARDAGPLPLSAATTVAALRMTLHVDATGVGAAPPRPATQPPSHPATQLLQRSANPAAATPSATSRSPLVPLAELPSSPTGVHPSGPCAHNHRAHRCCCTAMACCDACATCKDICKDASAAAGLPTGPGGGGRAAGRLGGWLAGRLACRRIRCQPIHRRRGCTAPCRRYGIGTHACQAGGAWRWDWEVGLPDCLKNLVRRPAH